MAELFKFRCSQCQKLLGAPPSRIGSTTTCPRCKTALIVPPPLEAEPDPESDDPEFGAINLEDLGLRLEPEPLSRPAAQPPTPAGPSPVAFLETLEAGPEQEPDLDPVLEGPKDELTTPLAPASLHRGRPDRYSVGRPRDVILPRTAVIAWSLFAILGLAAAFAAGMLSGHYLWR